MTDEPTPISVTPREAEIALVMREYLRGNSVPCLAELIACAKFLDQHEPPKGK